MSAGPGNEQTIAFSFRGISFYIVKHFNVFAVFARLGNDDNVILSRSIGRSLARAGTSITLAFGNIYRVHIYGAVQCKSVADGHSVWVCFGS